MEKPSLVIVTDMPPDSGIGIYAYRLYKEISKIVYNVSFLYTGYSNLPKEDGFVSYRQMYLSSNVFQKAFSKYYNYLSVKRIKFLRESNVHLCGSSYNLAKYTQHAVATFHDLYYINFRYGDFISPSSLFPKIGFNINTFNARRSLAYIQNVITISSVTQRQLKQITGKDSTVIHHWVDKDVFHPRSKSLARKVLNLPDNKKILLNVSGCGPNKNLGLLKRIADNLPEYYLLLKVGCPVQSDRAINIDKLPADLYPVAFNAADIYIHTSTCEGFGIPLIEALGSGLPVVSLDGPTAREVLGDAAIFFGSSSDEDEALTAIYEAAQADELQYLSALSLTRSRVFSKDEIVKKYLNFYRDSFPDFDDYVIRN
ncbi:MAG: glycosyltransferase [Nitrososphaerota archaeon]